MTYGGMTCHMIWTLAHTFVLAAAFGVVILNFLFYTSLLDNPSYFTRQHLSTTISSNWPPIFSPI